MSRHESLVRVRHMLDSARRVVKFTEAKSRRDLEQDEILRFALIQFVQIIGEASRKTTGEFQANHPDVEWRAIAGTRDRLIHGYDKVDLDLLWKICRVQISVLITKLERILAEE